MKLLIVTFTLFYYVAGVPYYQSNDYNSDSPCVEAQNSGWIGGKVLGCPFNPPPNNFYPDCNGCNGNQGYVQQEYQQQTWSAYTKTCGSKKNSCLKRCQWNLQCKTQCQLQFPCNWTSYVRSNATN